MHNKWLTKYERLLLISNRCDAGGRGGGTADLTGNRLVRRPENGQTCGHDPGTLDPRALGRVDLDPGVSPTPGPCRYLAEKRALAGAPRIALPDRAKGRLAGHGASAWPGGMAALPGVADPTCP